MGMQVHDLPVQRSVLWRCRMTSCEYSIQYPVKNGPSKWDLMLALFDREHDVRPVAFVFGTEPLPYVFPEPRTWELALSRRQEVLRTFESQVYVIGVETLVTQGESFHIKAHVTVPNDLFVGQSDYGWKDKKSITCLAEIYFRADRRIGNVKFMLLPT